MNLETTAGLFDKRIDISNSERPHEAPDMRCPVDVYRPSLRVYTGLSDIGYPFYDKTIVVTRCGRICVGKGKLISARFFPDRPWASKKFTTTSGRSALWTMFWGTSIWRTWVLEPLENPLAG